MADERRDGPWRRGNTLPLDHRPEPRHTPATPSAPRESEGGQPLVCQPGTLVDHFQVIRLIGRGGMGEVYLAYDTQLGRRVALKMVTSEWLDSDEAVERFLFEVRTTAKFSHPNIVTVYAAGKHEGHPYVALEYLKGQNLRDRMEERPPGMQESLRIALAIVEALEEAHRHGVLHRDLKPENVIIPLDGRLRVVDFGLAKQVQAPGAHLRDVDADGPVDSVRGTVLDSVVAERPPPRATPHSQQGLKGTPAYMAPEQWLEQETTAATDVWAVGALLFELCTGRLPFDEDTIGKHLAAVCSEQPAPRLDDFAQAPAELSSLVARCLEKDSSFRPAAADVAAGLRDMLLDTSAVGAGRESPFRGLLPFTERHAGWFFGREAEIGAFVERVRLHPVLPVVGPSGAGKSSFIQAGVIPRLREQEPWLIIQLRPGARPFHALASRLVRRDTWDGRSHFGDMSSLIPSSPSSVDDSLLDADTDAHDTLLAGSPPTEPQLSRPPGPVRVSERPPSTQQPPSRVAQEVEQLAAELARSPRLLSLRLRSLAEERGAKILLFVDQLEELFTLVADDETHASFIEALCTAAEDALDPVRIVLNVRDDFLGRLAVSEQAREALTHVTVIQRLDRAALEQTLVRPLQAAGYRFDESTLPTRMVASVIGERAGLPLLQFAAQMLWERRDTEKQLLLRAAYDEIGGVEGALAKHADGVLAGFSAGELGLARELLLRLVSAERTRKILTKKVALAGLEQLADGDGDDDDARAAEKVLTRLSDARLVSVSTVRGEAAPDAMLELAHESLIHTWTTLSRWLDESREELSFLGEVGQAAELWDRRGRRPEELWRGGALEEALRTAARCTTQLPGLVQEFLAAARTRQQRRTRRTRLAIASTIGGSITVALIAVLVAWFVAEKEQEARTQRDLAEQREARALREGARAALGHGRLLEARAKLRVALETEPQASTSARGLWWQLSRDPLVWTKEFGATVYAVAFSPDGKTIAAGCQDHAVYLLDARTGALRTLRGHEDQVLAVEFSPDGKRLASASWDGQVLLWDLGAHTQPRALSAPKTAVHALSFSADGSVLATGNTTGQIHLWDTATGEQRKQVDERPSGINDLRFSADGQTLASASSDGFVRLWDAATRALVRECKEHGGPAQAVDFSPDGKQLASGSSDRTVRLWRAGSCEVVRVLEGHSARVRRVRFAADGASLVSGSSDGTIRLWDVRTGEQRRVMRGHSSAVWDVSLSPDATLVVSGSNDHTVRLWSTQTAHLAPSLGGHEGGVWDVSFDPTGRLIASGSYDSTVRLWDRKTGKPRRVLEGHSSAVTCVQFSPDGQVLASGSNDHSVRLWDVESGKQQAVLSGHRAAVRDVSFSPAGTHLASASLDGTLRIWDAAKGHTLRLLEGHSAGVNGVSFAADGGWLASAGLDRSIRLWDVRSGAEQERLKGHTDPVWSVSISPSGRQLASTGSDRSVRLWDLQAGTHETIGHHDVRGYRVAFHPDGSQVASSGANGSAHIWRLSPRASFPLDGHQSDVNAITFSQDGAVAATAGDDRTIRIWSTETGRPYWRAPVLLGSPPRLFSHRGWHGLGPQQDASELSTAPGQLARPESALRKVIEEQARYSQAWGDELICLQTYDHRLQLWSSTDQRVLAEKSFDAITQLVAHPEGCAALSEGKLWLARADGTVDEAALDRTITAVAWCSDRLLVATDGQVHALSAQGEQRGRYDASAGEITALIGNGLDGAPKAQSDTRGWLAAGYRDGNIELLALAADGTRPSFSFEAVPASPPVRMIAGPMNTLIVGYTDGLLGLWNVRDGTQLGQVRLHGPVIHLQLHEHRLYAASELGDSILWDLGAFYLDDCQLIEQVWGQVPVVWDKGQPVVRAAPAGHRCRQP